MVNQKKPEMTETSVKKELIALCKDDVIEAMKNHDRRVMTSREICEKLTPAWTTDDVQKVLNTMSGNGSIKMVQINMNRQDHAAAVTNSHEISRAHGLRPNVKFLYRLTWQARASRRIVAKVAEIETASLPVQEPVPTQVVGAITEKVKVVQALLSEEESILLAKKHGLKVTVHPDGSRTYE